MRHIAAMLGHSELETTSLYIKHSPDFLSTATAALDDLFPAQIPIIGTKTGHDA